MKKIAKFLFVAAVAGLTIVACSKPKTPSKDQNKDNQENTDPKDDEEEAVLAIDGKFGEWEAIAPVEGDGALLITKAQMDNDKLYFFVQADLESIVTDDTNFANYLHVYLDCGEESSPISYWGGEGGCKYDKLFQIWLMTDGKANMANWDTGFVGKAKIDNGVYKAEFCLGRADETLKSKVIYYGMYLSDAYVDVVDGAEQWLGGDDLGLSPVQGEDMAAIKLAK